MTIQGWNLVPAFPVCKRLRKCVAVSGAACIAVFSCLPIGIRPEV